MSYYKNSYLAGDTFIDYSGNKYTVVTGGNTPSTPFDSSNIVNNRIVWGTIEFELLDVGGDKYQQITRTGVVAPQVVDITINQTVDFNKPPVEILKYGSNSQNVINTVNTFSTSEEAEFSYDNKRLKMDNTLHMITTYDLDFGAGVSLGSDFVYESEYIDPDDFVIIKEVTVE